MELVFCTLFDSNYLDKGLALYRSMRKNLCSFKLYVFAFDDKCFEVLSDMKLKQVIVLSVNDIMDARLQQIREERTCAEFCWTCTPIIIDHVLVKYREPICTYIDADIYFFSDPVTIVQEIVEHKCSVGLVAHNFERDWEYGRQVFELGKYCIQFNTFFHVQESMQVLQNWKEDCLNWCYNRCEDGKFGDQKYPDHWQQKYPCVYESKNAGAGAAPWNLHLYSDFVIKSGHIWAKYRGNLYPLVFYHFEGMTYFHDNSVFLNLWKPYQSGTARKIRIIYGEYFQNIGSIQAYLAKTYNITFQHRIADKKAFFGKRFSLLFFCREKGFFYGIKAWYGYWTNNVVKKEKLIRGSKGGQNVFAR